MCIHARIVYVLRKVYELQDGLPNWQVVILALTRPLKQGQADDEAVSVRAATSAGHVCKHTFVHTYMQAYCYSVLYVLVLRSQERATVRVQVY